MLRRVARDDVKVGMFIHAMEGSWLHHPFWRRRFLLTEIDDLTALQESAVAAVMIDDERGIGPDETEPPAPVAPTPIRKAPSLIPPGPCSAREEYDRASKIVTNSKRMVARMFGEVRLGNAIRPADAIPLVDEIAASIERNASALIGIARLKTKNEYTYMHSVAVCALMINLARHLELDEGLIREVGMAGLLHDIGKMAVPEPVLNKPGKLSDAEFAVVRGHPQRGYDILNASGEVPDIALDVCLHHHEKFDGSGYPQGLAGTRISRFARMGAVCDVYDAITSNRPYKDGWSPAESIARMEEWQGHFEPELLARFVRSIGIWPVGTLVRLRSNRLGLVVGDNPCEPTRPRVAAFYSIMDRELIEPELLTVTDSLKGDQIIRREQPANWNLGDWGGLVSRLLARAA